MLYVWVAKQRGEIVKGPYPPAFFLPLFLFDVCGQKGLDKTFETVNDNIFILIMM